MDKEKISTANDSMVGLQGDKIWIMMPPVGAVDKDKALRLAAYLVLMAGEDRFNEILKACKAV